MRRSAILLACALLAAPGCKGTPVDDNRDPVQYFGVPDVTPLDGPHAGPPDAESPDAESPNAESQHVEPPQSVDVPEAGPALREALRYLPLGHAAGLSKRAGRSRATAGDDTVPVPDRWRVGFPAWERGSRSDSPYDVGSPFDPYHQNVWKGDYPIPGTQNTFLNVEATAISLFESRKSPTPSSVFPRASGAGDFFGKGNQQQLAQTVLLTADLFHGETAFKPVDWRFFVRGAFNWNNARVRENTALFADPGRGTNRTDRHAALQQAFFETTLAAINDKYDVVQMRLGTQLFNSDFKGFLFFDEALGARVFGSFDDNLYQWNAGLFRRWDKDTNSGLNTFDSIKADVFLLNLYRQDVLQLFVPRTESTWWSKGLTSQISYHHFKDSGSVHYDENDFLVRPRAVGVPVPNHNRVDYLGWTNDGHIGRLNITSALYKAWGEESFNEIAQQETDIDASMAALELSVDVDWMRFKVFGFYQSGDSDALDGDAEGFDAIFDNPVFAGGEFGFWNRNTVRLTGSGVGLVQRFSLLNSLRSSKDQGQPSFVNPGLLLGGVGYDAQLTPHLKLITNASYLRFEETDAMERVLNQDAIGEEIGYDLSAGVLWRPLLTDNVIVKGGASALVPGKGFRKIYTAETLYTLFVEVLLTW